jgi:hypothetical protein
MDSSTKDLTDLNSIPKPCPYLQIIYIIIFDGVVEHWVNLRLILYKKNNR